MATETLVKDLLNAGVHFGHQTRRWNPKMRRFIFGSRSGIYIIDLEQTERQLKAAGDFLEQVAAKGDLILFVGTKKQAKTVIREQADRAGVPYVINRWMGGSLTNYNTIRKNIDRLEQLRVMKASGEMDRLSKKDAKRLERQQDELEENYASLTLLSRLPSCVFIVDPKREFNAVREARRLKIPIIAICDTNADPDEVTYPIPGNDDAIRSIRLIATMLADRVLDGRRRAGAPIVSDTPEPAVSAN